MGEGFDTAASPAGKVWLEFLHNEDDHDVAGAVKRMDEARRTIHWVKPAPDKNAKWSARATDQRQALRAKMVAFGLTIDRFNPEAMPSKGAA